MRAGRCWSVLTGHVRYNTGRLVLTARKSFQTRTASIYLLNYLDIDSIIFYNTSLAPFSYCTYVHVSVNLLSMSLSATYIYLFIHILKILLEFYCSCLKCQLVVLVKSSQVKSNTTIS